MRLPSVTTFVGNDVKGEGEWFDYVTGADGYAYGIPFGARRVVTFNPIDISMTPIGQDLGCERRDFRRKVFSLTTTAFTVVLLIGPFQF